MHIISDNVKKKSNINFIVQYFFSEQFMHTCRKKLVYNNDSLPKHVCAF